MAPRARKEMMCRARKEREEDDCPMCHVKLKDSLVNGFVVTIVILGFIPTALKQTPIVFQIFFIVLNVCKCSFVVFFFQF